MPFLLRVLPVMHSNRQRQHGPTPSVDLFKGLGSWRIALAVPALIGATTVAAQAVLPARVAPTWTVAADAYYPEAGNAWERRTAARSGLDSSKLAAAIQFAISAESKAPRDFEIAHYQTFGREPFGNAVGPFKARGEPSGVILRHGYVVAEWGEPERVDMSFSVTKSFLSTVVGVAVDRGMIRSVRDTVANYVGPICSAALGAAGLGAESPADGRWLKPFESAHNKRITWEDMLRQTSDWEGTLWGKPDWADRPTGQPANWLGREASTSWIPSARHRHGAVRIADLASRTVEEQTPHVGGLGESGANTDRTRVDLRVHELVCEHRSPIRGGRASERVYSRGKWDEHYLLRPNQRYCCGGALNRERFGERVY